MNPVVDLGDKGQRDMLPSVASRRFGAWARQRSSGQRALPVPVLSIPVSKFSISENFHLVNSIHLRDNIDPPFCIANSPARELELLISLVVCSPTELTAPKLACTPSQCMLFSV